MVMCDVLGWEKDPSMGSGQAPLGTSLRLDVAGLPEGTYYLRCSSGGFVVTRRIEIER